MLRDAIASAIGDDPKLIDRAIAVHDAGTRAWPGVVVRPEALARRVAERARTTEAETMAHDADLYLAVALADGSAEALAIFERHLVPEIDVALGRMRLAPALFDEIRQAVRVNLLVRDGGEARIEGYLGFGALADWLRVTATRRALRVLRTTAREDSLDEVALAGLADASSGPERRHLHREYAGHLKAAVTEAVASLTVRERNLIKQHVLDDLTVDELALVYRVHRSTCARWLVDARAALGRATRRALSDRLGPLEGQLDSVLRFVESDLELSLSRILRAPAAP